VKVLKPKGEINFDCIKTKDSIKIIEINGRFAGGAPISFKAGANSPQNLYKLLLGETLKYNENYNG
jgi:carbamoyl-phosphate synthase large subunit